MSRYKSFILIKTLHCDSGLASGQDRKRFVIFSEATKTFCLSCQAGIYEEAGSEDETPKYFISLFFITSQTVFLFERYCMCV